jgi:hypothetical protein
MLTGSKDLWKPAEQLLPSWSIVPLGFCTSGMHVMVGSDLLIGRPEIASQQMLSVSKQFANGQSPSHWKPHGHGEP